jgi:hypothetical protein
VTATDTPVTQALAALLVGETTVWKTLRVSDLDILETCAKHRIGALVSRQIRALSTECDWPSTLREELAGAARNEVAREALSGRELMAVLAALSRAGVNSVLLKGAGLAYSLYEEPHLRPRCDTDLIVPRAAIDTARETLLGIGYHAPPYCDGELLFHQLPFAKTDKFGVIHRLDLHWKISTEAMFADVLSFETLAEAAIPVPRLGPHARTAGHIHALLLACMHAVMHHRNEERLIWMYDMHALATRLPTANFARFAELAVAGGVATVCAHSLTLVRARFGTPIPTDTLARLRAPRDAEATSVYLRPARRWRHELVSNLRGLNHWRDRRRLLREILLPAPSYMLDAYGLPPGSRGAVLLPLLYLHRGVRGGINALIGRK